MSQKSTPLEELEDLKAIAVERGISIQSSMENWSEPCFFASAGTQEFDDRMALLTLQVLTTIYGPEWREDGVFANMSIASDGHVHITAYNGDTLPEVAMMPSLEGVEWENDHLLREESPTP